MEPRAPGPSGPASETHMCASAPVSFGSPGPAGLLAIPRTHPALSSLGDLVPGICFGSGCLSLPHLSTSLFQVPARLCQLHCLRLSPPHFVTAQGVPGVVSLARGVAAGRARPLCLSSSPTWHGEGHLAEEPRTLPECPGICPCSRTGWMATEKPPLLRPRLARWPGPPVRSISCAPGDLVVSQQ